MQTIQENNIEKTLTIYKKYNNLINRKIYLFTGYNNLFDDDLKNEITLSIYKSISKYSEDNSSPAYLNKTIDRTLLNYLRKVNNKKDKIIKVKQNIAKTLKKFICLTKKLKQTFLEINNSPPFRKIKF